MQAWRTHRYRAHQSPLLVFCHRLWAMQHLWGHSKLCNEWGVPGCVRAQGRLAWDILGQGPPSEELPHHAQRWATRAKIIIGAVAPGLPVTAMGTGSTPNAQQGWMCPGALPAVVWKHTPYGVCSCRATTWLSPENLWGIYYYPLKLCAVSRLLMLWSLQLRFVILSHPE